MGRRSRLEIYFEILEAILRGTEKPTRIMYKTNLSWITLQEIFEILMDGSFIEERMVKNAKRYYITEKGRSALAYHKRSLEGLIETR